MGSREDVGGGLRTERAVLEKIAYCIAIPWPQGWSALEDTPWPAVAAIELSMPSLRMSHALARTAIAQEVSTVARMTAADDDLAPYSRTHSFGPRPRRAPHTARMISSSPRRP